MVFHHQGLGRQPLASDDPCEQFGVGFRVFHALFRIAAWA
jgi:hypothetical protein